MATDCSRFLQDVNNLSVSCPNHSWPVDQDFDAPFTFFVHVLKLSLCLLLLVILIVSFHSVRLLNRVISCVSTCAVYWILYILSVGLKSLLVVVFLPLTSPESTSAHRAMTSVGVISTSVVQIAVVFFLFVALDHERLFRSPKNAISIGSATNARCVTALKPSFKTHVFSWLRLSLLFLCIATLLVFVALQVFVQVSAYNSYCTAIYAVGWSYVGLLVLLRLGVVFQVVAIMLIKDPSLKPTWKAKGLVLTALVLNLGEDLPSFVLTYPFHNLEIVVGLQHPCVLYIGTLYDLLQLLALCSLPFMMLFVRAQFNRIEQVCRHEMVYEVAKQLQGDTAETESIASVQSDTVVLVRPKRTVRSTPTRL